MYMDPDLPYVVGAVFAILLVGWILRRLRQPHVVVYLLAGFLLGPHTLGFITDEHTIMRLGELGVVLLLFFVGMEVSLPRLVSGWKIAVGGTALQILASVAMVSALGTWLQWPLPRIVLIGFAISLSSTAVVISLLRDRGESDSDAGRDAVGILLTQDMAIIPMLIVLGLMQGETPSFGRTALQVVGGVLISVLVILLLRYESLTLPFAALLREDHELQVFSALLLCFGFSLITGLVGLSTAIGAFLAGIVVTATRETEWVHRSMEPFRVILVAVFFVSIGMLLDPEYLIAQWWMLLLLVTAAFIINTVVSAGILRALGRGWSKSLYVGGLLAPIGEFSFVLAAAGRQAGIINEFAHQMTISVIAMSLILSPVWIQLTRRMSSLGDYEAPVADGGVAP